MNLFKIYPSSQATDHCCISMTEMETPEEALEEARSQAGVECFLETTAYAEKVIEP